MGMKHKLMAERLKEVLSSKEFLLFPMDWGAAQEVNTMEEEGHVMDTGLVIVRYDIPLHGYGDGTHRFCERSPEQIRKHLETGITWIISRKGVYEARQISPVDFNEPRIAVPIEDWSEYTNQGLLAGTDLCLEGSKILNLSGIYPAGFTMPVLTRRRPPEEYKGLFKHLITPDKADSYREDPLGMAKAYIIGVKHGRQKVL